MSEQAPPIRRLSEREVFGNRFIKVYNDDVTAGDGSWTGQYLRIVESGGRPGAAVLAMAGRRVGLVRVFRYALDEWEWALPRGFAHGDDPADTARTELAEELGGEPDELVPLGTVAPNSGLLASRVHLYLARYAEQVASPTDTREVDAVRWIDLADLFAEIADGRITDGFTMSALTAAYARGLLAS